MDAERTKKVIPGYEPGRRLPVDRPGDRKLPKELDPRKTATLPAGRTGVPIEKLDIPHDSKVLIYLEYMEKNGDRAAGDLRDVLQKVDQKTADRILGRDPKELLADYKRGLLLFSPDKNDDLERRSLVNKPPLTELRARFIERDIDARFEDIKFDDLTARMDWLYDLKAHPLENFFRYVTLVDHLTDLNDILPLNFTQSDIITRAGALINFENIFSFITGKTIGAAENILRDMTAESPEKISPALADVIAASLKDDPLGTEKCAVAAKSLQKAGEHGFNSLLTAYIEVVAQSRANGKAKPVVDITFEASLEMLEDPSTRAPRSLSLLEAVGHAGSVSDPAGTMNAYRNVMSSSDKELQQIKDEVKQNEEAIRMQAPGARAFHSAEAIYLFAMIKALLVERSYNLISEGKLKEARDVLKNAESFGVAAATTDLRYAMALTLYASGNKKEASEQLKKALILDDDTLTGLTKILDRVPATIAGNTWMDLAGNFEGVRGAAEKIIEYYVLGYLSNMHFNEKADALMFLRMVKSYPKIWNALENYFNAGDREGFVGTLDNVVSQIKALDRKNLSEDAPIQPLTRIIKHALENISATLP